MVKSTNKQYDLLKQQIRNLPEKPGVYQYYNADGLIIYVGKAKNLKKRVASYFTKDKQISGKVRMLVRKIQEIQFIVVDTELDALLLENNLIKKHQPKYNIQLKDDKTYPWICIKNEDFPRIFPTRTIVRDGSDYFGPYASAKMMHTLLDLIRQIYPIRNCSLKLSEENIKSKKFKVCLEYHLGNCLAPCIGKQSPRDYQENINTIRYIIKGNISQVIKQLQQLMKEYAEGLDFENAQHIKEKIDILKKYQSRSTIVSPGIKDADVFSILDSDKEAYVNYLKVIDGAIVQAHTIEIKKHIEEDKESLLLHAIIEIRKTMDSKAPEVILPFDPQIELPGIRFSIPKIGEKKHLLELSERNTKYYKLEKDKQRAHTNPAQNTQRILERMQKDLRLKSLPKHIECFDNSNFQGSNPVAAMVMFRNAKPHKKGYRHFNIKTVVGPDDFASMEEVVYRRYSRLLEEKQELPQLIIVDGGKGQLSAAVRSLDKLGLRGKIAIIGIAKRLEEIYYPGDSVPMYIDKTSETLKIIQHLRDEAHRFGITHHRNQRSKSSLQSALMEIKGIGPQTEDILLKQFKSVKRLKEIDHSELSKFVGQAKAHLIIEHFKKG